MKKCNCFTILAPEKVFAAIALIIISEQENCRAAFSRKMLKGLMTAHSSIFRYWFKREEFEEFDK